MRWNSILLCYSRTNDKHSTRMHGKNYLRVVENLTADLRIYNNRYIAPEDKTSELLSGELGASVCACRPSNDNLS